jgi:hypothetical protein
MKTLRFAAFALGFTLAGCGSGSSVGNVSGTWTCRSTTPSCVNWMTSQPVLGVSSGSTNITLGLGQSKGGVVTLDPQPTEGNGVTWSCPESSLDGDTLALGNCTLTSGHCTASVTPGITIAKASGSTPMLMTWQGYHYTWGGSSCTVGNGVTVTVTGFELTLGGR